MESPSLTVVRVDDRDRNTARAFSITHHRLTNSSALFRVVPFVLALQLSGQEHDKPEWTTMCIGHRDSLITNRRAMVYSGYLSRHLELDRLQ